MSAYGTFSPTARPQGSCQHRGRCPHPRSPRGRGRETLLHPYHRALSPPTCKGQGRYAVASQALTGFQLRPLRLVLLPHGDGEVKGDEVVHFTLDALNRLNTHRRGRWIGFATCPCGLASESGFGASLKGLFFVFEVVRVDVTVQKRSKNVHF